MNKLIPAITLVALVGLQLPTHASWAAKQQKTATQEAEQAPTPGFNQKDDRQAFIKVDYLFWRPQLENAGFALKSVSSAPAEQPQSVKFTLKQPECKLSSGVRLGIGGYTHDSWDIGLTGTYLRSKTHKHIHGNPSTFKQTLPQWVPSVFGTGGLNASALWALNFSVLDFAIGREFFLTKRFAVHPFIGLRGYCINQKLKNHFQGTFLQGTSPNQVSVTLPSKFKVTQSIFGAGPRLGLDMGFYVSQDWAFLGGLSGSLLCSTYRIKQNAFAHINTVDTTGTILTINNLNLKTKDGATLGRANLDAYFGIGWDKWCNNGRNRFAVSLLFEASHWFQINQLLDIDTTSLENSNNQLTSQNRSQNTTFMAEKRHGDLSFMGGTVHFQFDF
jgi:hypothetical protein